MGILFAKIQAEQEQEKSILCDCLCSVGNFIRTQRNECRSGYNRIPQKLLQDRPHIMAQNFADVSDYIGGADIKDPGYAAVVKAFQTFSTNYQAYLVFIALLFMIPMAIWIYRNSSMPCLSFIIFQLCFIRFMRLPV